MYVCMYACTNYASLLRELLYMFSVYLFPRDAKFLNFIISRVLLCVLFFCFQLVFYLHYFLFIYLFFDIYLTRVQSIPSIAICITKIWRDLRYQAMNECN